MDLYIDGSGYSAAKELGIVAKMLTRKVMVKIWIRREEIFCLYFEYL
jgi:hypothetical protein